MARRSGALLEFPIELLIRATGILTILLLFGILALLARQGLRLFLELDYPIDKFLTFDNAITGGATKVLSNVPAGRVMLARTAGTSAAAPPTRRSTPAAASMLTGSTGSTS